MTFFEASNDVVTANWGNGWRMPTDKGMQLELTIANNLFKKHKSTKWDRFVLWREIIESFLPLYLFFVKRQSTL